jgi:hypothetical protein
MDTEQKKALAIVAGAVGASLLIYRMCHKKPKPRCITISGTATANGSILGRSNSKESEIWIERFETAFDLATLAYQAWLNVKKRSS